MSDRTEALVKETRQQRRAAHHKPMANSGFGPTLSFKEVVDRYGLKSGKLRAAFRYDETAPKARSAFNSSSKSTVYYDRAEIVKYVTTNLEKLK